VSCNPVCLRWTARRIECGSIGKALAGGTKGWRVQPPSLTPNHFATPETYGSFACAGNQAAITCRAGEIGCTMLDKPKGLLLDTEEHIFL
jgi:hypothetical protein